MKKIKTLKIKNEDGSISAESYTISADAINIDMKNKKNLQETIGNIDIDEDGSIENQLKILNENAKKKKVYYFDNIADMKNAKDLKIGDYVVTKGYYTANDGGGADYLIKERKDSVKNQLFNKNDANIVSAFVNADSGLYTKADKNQQSLLIRLQPNKTYTISGFERSSNIGLYTSIPEINNSFATRVFVCGVKSSVTFTTNQTEIYLVALFNNSSNSYSYDNVMLNYGNIALKYEDYPENENNGTIFFLANHLMAEMIIKNDYINIKQFGAKGDGVTDDTVFINKALNYVKLYRKKILIPEGTFLTKGLFIDFSRCYIQGVDRKKSIIKGISLNEGSIIYCYNNGTLFFNINNLTIEGNKNEVADLIDGIKFFSDINIPDTYSNISEMNIQNCSGNGIILDSSYSGTGVREIRINNNNIYNNELNGIFCKSVSDSNIFQNTCHTNKKCGFYIKGGNIKILQNKAHNNGYGDESTLEELYRIPDEAFILTEDTSYHSEKKYYTRTGKGTSDSPFIFTLFSGSSFNPNINYYEIDGIYYKKYPGYLIEGWSCLISNCEAQDSFGDGFYITGQENNIENILADGNGKLTLNGTSVTYESLGMFQLYDGVYLKNTYSIFISGIFKNFRYNALHGKLQRAAICLDNCNGIIANITTTNQVVDILIKILQNVI